MVELFQVAVYRSQLSPVDPEVGLGEVAAALEVDGAELPLPGPPVLLLAPPPAVEVDALPFVGKPVGPGVPDVGPMLADVEPGSPAGGVGA